MSENPWLSIWVRPKTTIRKVVEENPKRSLWTLSAIYGFSSLLNLFQSMGVGRSLGPIEILVLALIFSPLWGYVSFTIGSWVVTFTGKWIKGKANFQMVRAAYAWSSVPFVFNIAFWLILMALFGRDLFLFGPDGPFSNAMISFLFAVSIAKVVLSIWALVIYINALAEVQQFSILRAIGNLLLAILVVMVIVFLVWTLSSQLLSAGIPFNESRIIFEMFSK